MLTDSIVMKARPRILGVEHGGIVMTVSIAFITITTFITKTAGRLEMDMFPAPIIIPVLKLMAWVLNGG